MAAKTSTGSVIFTDKPTTAARMAPQFGNSYRSSSVSRTEPTEDWCRFMDLVGDYVVSRHALNAMSNTKNIVAEACMADVAAVRAAERLEGRSAAIDIIHAIWLRAVFPEP